MQLLFKDEAALEAALEARTDGEAAARFGHSWAWHGKGPEWHAFATTWNALVFSLRTRDMISNTERDDLLFESLSDQRHQAFFRCEEYSVLPTMLSSPVFTSSRDLSLVSPRYTRYSALCPTLLQLRDLLLYVLVAAGILPRKLVRKAREHASELLLYAQVPYLEQMPSAR